MKDLTRKAPKRTKTQTPKSQRFSDHLHELRSRITWCVVFLIIGTVIGYLIHDKTLAILVQPLNQPIFFASPAGGFDFTLKLSLFFGFLFALPITIYHSIRFIEPALPKRLPGVMLKVLLSSSFLLILGMAFAYFVSLPAALYFLSQFTTDSVRSLISTTEYFSFVTRYLLGFGLLFQLPLILLTVNALQSISIKSLMKHQRWVILAAFVVSAILTPTPDLFNQLIMAIPIILLYQATIVLIWLVNVKKNRFC